MKRSLSVVLVLAGIFCQTCIADLYSEGADKDTWVAEGRGSNNYGNVGYFSTGDGWTDGGQTRNHERGIFHFDLSAYAGKTVVGDATLTMWVPSGYIAGMTKGKIMSVYSMYSTNASWGEMTASYNYRDGVGTWVDASGADTAYGLGDAYNPTAVGIASVPGSGLQFMNFTLSAALIQSWINNSAANAGLIAIVNGEAEGDWIGWSSREGGTGPSLSFTAIPEPATMLSLLAGGLFVARRKK